MCGRGDLGGSRAAETGVAPGNGIDRVNEIYRLCLYCCIGLELVADAESEPGATVARRPRLAATSPTEQIQETHDGQVS